jgi:hypothetical protein
MVPNEYGLPKLYLREGRTLSAPSGLKPAEIAKSFLRSQPDVFALSTGEVDRLRLIVEDVTDTAKFLAFNQTLNGIDVFNGQIKFTLNKDGEVIQVATADVVPGLDIATTPQLTTEEAAKAAFAAIGTPRTTGFLKAKANTERTAFENPNGQNYSPISVELAIFPVTALSARLAYRIFLEVDSRSWYEILVDANTGALLYRHNLYVFAAQARVWIQSPLGGPRALVDFPAPSTANPEGWLPTTSTVTTGNNVDAFLDANGNDLPDTTTDPNMSMGRAFNATQVFDFPFGDGTVQQDPRLFQPAAVTNLFYFVNIAHDYFYNLGFNEAAGNFQTNNFGRGGVGNDAIIAEAQSGRAPNNASLAVTPEGLAPRLRVGLFTVGTSTRLDDLDADYDGAVLLHEYTHGVTNRLVGARTSTSCLVRIQSGAMGEGWSDYFAASYFNDPVLGAYVAKNPASGLRRFSYENYPLKYEDVGAGTFSYEVHDDGEIWAGTLWDLRKTLGAETSDRLVLNGLKSTPCRPSMTDARDAILTADQATNNNANRMAIWTVFARHGLGYSAFGVEGSIQSGTRYDASYDLPPDLQTTRNPAITSNPLTIRTGLGDAYRYTIAGSNPGAGTLNYVLTSGPTGMTVDASTGLVTWPAQFVSPRVKITVTDGKGGRVIHGYSLPILTVLNNTRTVTISGPKYSTGYATISVPPGAPVLQFKIRAGSGDADMYVVNPNGFIYDSLQDGNTETVSFSNPISGDWLVLVDGYDTYAGVSLTASAITPTPISANTPLTNLNGEFTSETFYKVTVPSGATALTVTTTGGVGDVDILLRRGAPAVCQPFSSSSTECSYDKVSGNEGNEELITVPNPGAGDWYLDLIGYEPYSGVTLSVNVPIPTLTLTNTGSATATTLGSSANVVAGYATANLENGTAPFGTAVFSLTQNGFVVSEAGVPASPPVQSARVFIEYRTGVTAGIGTIDTSTGLAIANRGSGTASITYTLRDRTGQILATGHGTLAQNAHVARFVHELQSIAPDFSLPANFPTAVRYGSLEISSSQPISILGLRLTSNQRGETLLTSTSIANLAQTAGSSPVYFPQLADGAGYTTTIILSNTTNATQTGTIAVIEDGGAPLTVRSAEGTTASSFSYSIPAAGTFVFQTDGSAPTIRFGWIKVTPNSGSTSPVGAGVFSYTPAGILVTESGIPSATATTRARIYVDKSAGHDTGLAIGNPGSTALSLTVQAFQGSGATAGNGPATLNIPSNGHKAAFVGELIDGLPTGFTGIADLTSTVPFVPLTVRSLTNGRGDFLLTTFPAADVTQPAPTPIVFPQIADGGGYTTQFIFISASGPSSVSITFIGDDGTPLSVGRN